MLRTQFTPRNISNLSLWLDGADASTVTLDGSSNVSQWNDKSGEGRNVSQSISNNRPAYSATINGLKVLTFDGSNDLLATAGNYGETKWTVFAVVKPATTAAGARNIVCVDRGVPPRGPQNARINGATYQAIGFESGGAKTESAGTAAVAGTTQVVAVVQTATALEIWINDATNGSTACAQQAYSDPIVIGGGLGQIMNGDIGEVLLYGRDLSGDERRIVQRYLGRKWGVTL